MVNIFSSRLQNTKNLAQKLEFACSIAAPKNWYDVTSGANHILGHIAYMFVLVKLKNIVRFKYKGRFANTCFIVSK